jgi:hypothetical protein
MRSNARSSKKRKFRGTPAEHARQGRELARIVAENVEEANQALDDQNCTKAFAATIKASINSGGSRAHGASTSSDLIDLVRAVSQQCVRKRY